MKKTSKPIIHILLVVFLLLTASLACNLPSRSNPVLVVALKSNGAPTLSVYAGDPEKNPFWLPAGDYYLEAMDSDGMIYSGWREVVRPVIDGGDTILLNYRTSGDAQADEAIAAQLQTLASFMLSVDLAQLTYLEIASGGFQDSFQASVNAIQMSDLDPFYSLLQDIADQEASVYAAVQALESRANNSTSAVLPDHDGALANKVLSRPSLDLSDLWDSVKVFFSFKSEEGELARQEILTISAAMTPGEKEEAFYWLAAERIGGAQNYDEFLTQLQAGNLKDITRIRSDLHTGGPYQGVAQTLNPDSNRPGGETIHRAGAELVTRGAALHVDVVKEVLSTVFPGMDKGFEYADKAAEWAEFARNMYIEPLGTLQGLTADIIKSEITEDIQLDLMSAIPGLDEETAEELAGTLSHEIVTSHTALITTLIEAQAEAQPTSTQAADTVVCTGVGEAEYQLAAAQLGLAPEKPEDPETASYIVCTDHATGLTVSVELVEENADIEDDDVTPTPGDETAVIPTGVYKGVTNIPQRIQIPSTVIEENEIIVIVEEDGTTYGEIRIRYSWSYIFWDNEPKYVTVISTAEIEGHLSDSDGILNITYNNSMIDCYPCEEIIIQGYDNIPYEIHVSGNAMSVTPIWEVADTGLVLLFSFELTRQ